MVRAVPSEPARVEHPRGEQEPGRGGRVARQAAPLRALHRHQRGRRLRLRRHHVTAPYLLTYLLFR